MNPGGRTERDDLFSEAKRELKPLVLRVYPAVLTLMLLLIAAGAASDLERWQLFIDPAEARGDVLIGVFSNIGVLLWWTTVAVTGLTWLVLRRSDDRSEFSRMCGCAALLTAFLALDDLFLLHDYVFPELVHIPEGLVLVVILGSVAAYLWRFRVVLLSSSNRLVLAAALLLLCASVAADAFSGGPQGHETFEDGFKIAGIATWLFYFVSLCLRHVRPSP